MSSIDSIGAAVIGTGFIGTVHVEALRRIGVTVHGVLESTPDRGNVRAQAFACGPRATGPTRRYAGTPHIDVANLSADAARDLAAQIRASGLAISGLGYYPNPLHPGPAHRAEVTGHLKHVITAAERMDAPLVNTLMGADGARNQEENRDEALKVWPEIVAVAASPATTAEALS